VRIAIVDIGTNSTRLMVGLLDEGAIVRELERLTTVTRLGAGVDATGRLDSEAMQRVYDTLERYAGRIEAHRATEAHAVLTSAVRDASNGAQFAREVAERFHLTTHVLDGEREALLTYRGAISDRHRTGVGEAGRDLGHDLMLVIDIGGGSTELVLGDQRTIVFHVSTNAGVVRQSERHIRSDPPTDAELCAVAEDVRATLDAAVPPALRSQVALAIAVAGTPTSLAAIAQRLEPYDPQRTHGYRLAAAERDSIFGRLAAMKLEQRQTVPGLQPARAGVIVPGIVILREVMGLFSLDFVEVSEHDILHGAMLAAAEGKL
jgi:exopolyphosphatase/guanosine-5'-triphosphate,3'-diphosphate pyrophosphatase